MVLRDVQRQQVVRGQVAVTLGAAVEVGGLVVSAVVGVGWERERRVRREMTLHLRGSEGERRGGVVQMEEFGRRRCGGIAG